MQRAVVPTGIGDVKADYAALLALAADAAALVDELNLLLAANQLSPPTTAPLDDAPSTTIAASTDAGTAQPRLRRAAAGAGLARISGPEIRRPPMTDRSCLTAAPSCKRSAAARWPAPPRPSP